MNTNILETTMEETSGDLQEPSLEPCVQGKSGSSIKTTKSITKEALDMIDETTSQEIEELFGPRKAHNIPMTPKFLDKLEAVCAMGPFPVTVVNKLVKAGLNCPHTLINTFGGGIIGLAMRIAYMKVS